MVDLKCSFISHITPKAHHKLVQLVGEKCIIDCEIGGFVDEALWDTGAQVSLLSKLWLEKNKCDSVVIQSLESLVGADSKSISLSGAGGSKIPYIGYVTLPVLLKGRSEAIDVPFLVTAGKLSNPIIGYNVIKAVAQLDEDNVVSGENGFFRGLSDGVVGEVMALLVDPESEHLSHAKTVKTRQLVKKKSSRVISLKIDSVHVNQRTPVFFEPSLESLMLFDDNLVLGEQLVMLKKGMNQKIKVSLINTTDRDIEIPARMVLGDINLVSMITPVAAKLKDSDVRPVTEVENGEGSIAGGCNSVNVDSSLCSASLPRAMCPRKSEDVGSEKEAESEKKTVTEEAMKVEPGMQYTKLRQHIESMKLDHLDENIQKEVRDMLWRKRDAFCSDDGEIGEAKDLNMNIKTTDEVPIQKKLLQNSKAHD